MTRLTSRNSSTGKVRAHRERMRGQGFRPVMLWAPDVRLPEVQAQVRKECRSIAESPGEPEDQAFVDESSEDLWTRLAAKSGRWPERISRLSRDPPSSFQDDAFADLKSATVCLLTSASEDTPMTRPLLTPSAANGLRQPSRLMVDKITTVPRAKLGQLVGRLTHDEITRLDRALLFFLGLAR